MASVGVRKRKTSWASMAYLRRPDVVDVEEEGHDSSSSGSFGDLDADESLVRFRGSDVLGAAGFDGLRKLRASVMEMLSSRKNEVEKKVGGGRGGRRRKERRKERLGFSGLEEGIKRGEKGGGGGAVGGGRHAHGVLSTGEDDNSDVGSYWAGPNC